MYHFSQRKGPLYIRIKGELIAKIERGTWPLGWKLPTEEELTRSYGVSRETVRRALAEMEQEGYLDRLAGRGTFVARVTPNLLKRVGDIVSFTSQLARAGFEPQTRVLFAGLIPATDTTGRVIEGFGIPPETPLVHIKRLRLGSDLPFALQSVYLLPQLCPDILEEDLTSLWKLYEVKYNKKISAADEIVRLSSASREEAALLAMAPGAPVAVRDRISFDQHGEPFEVLHSLDRGDRFAYRYMIGSDLTSIIVQVGSQDKTMPRRKYGRSEQQFDGSAKEHRG